jgi:hypothetical protein
VGVIAATAGPTPGEIWAYVVPARHVQRLLDARDQKGVVLLRHQRPTVGLTLKQGAEEGTVEVERVEQGGPAARAGIAIGDVVVACDGRKIRSPYQAVGLILNKQPGDVVQMLLEQAGQTRSVDVQLQGAPGAHDAVENYNYRFSGNAPVQQQQPAAPGQQGQVQYGPPQVIRRSENQIEVYRSNLGEQQRAVLPESQPVNRADLQRAATVGRAQQPDGTAGATPESAEMRLLRMQVESFARQINELQLEVLSLRKQAETAKPAKQ